MQGVVVQLSKRGYGFIKPAGGSVDMFFHASGMQNKPEFNHLNIDDVVSYDVDDSGEKPKAVNVAIVSV